jgi:hypothetical protein
LSFVLPPEEAKEDGEEEEEDDSCRNDVVGAHGDKNICTEYTR